MQGKEGESLHTVKSTKYSSNRLEELAEKSAQKNGGSTAHYIAANQALKEDLIDFLNEKFYGMQQKINDLKEEIKQSRAKEVELLREINTLKSKCRNQNSSQQDVYLIGSSILREVKPNDLKNGCVKSISGGKVKDIQADISNLEFTPKTIISLVGGNGIDSEREINKVVAEYTVSLTKMKEKFPNTKVVVAGLPPHHPTNKIRTKTKGYNESLKKCCDTNNICFIENESLFEYRSGEVDVTSYIMTGATPAVHLTRSATIRLLKNIQQKVPEMILSDQMQADSSYADAVKRKPQTETKQNSHVRLQQQKDHYQKRNTWNNPRGTYTNRQYGSSRIYESEADTRGCYFFSETNHTKNQCKFGQKIACNFCKKLGHKEKFCVLKRNSYVRDY